jgi:hypothetical protein
VIRFLVEEDFNNDLVRGLLRRSALTDRMRVQDLGLRGATDDTVLARAASEGRVVLTHDASTLIARAYDRVRAGQPMPGVIAVSQALPVDRSSKTFCSSCSAAPLKIGPTRCGISRYADREDPSPSPTLKADALLLVDRFEGLAQYPRLSRVRLAREGAPGVREGPCRSAGRFREGPRSAEDEELIAPRQGAKAVTPASCARVRISASNVTSGSPSRSATQT